MRTDLKHGAGAENVARAVAKAGIEEAGIVDAELAHGRIESHHFCGEVGGNAHSLLGRQDVEIAGVEDDGLVPGFADGFPEVVDGVVIQHAQVHRWGVLAGFVGDGIGVCVSLEAHGDAHAFVDQRAGGAVVAGVNQDLVLVQAGCPAIGQGGIAADEAQLIQARSHAGDDGEGARDHLDIQGAGVSRTHLLELDAVIGDKTGEDVKPAGGAFGICAGRDALGEMNGFEHRNDVDATALQHCRAAQVDGGHLQGLDPVHHRGRLAGKKTGLDAIGDRTEAEIKTGGLNLAVFDGSVGCDDALVDEFANMLGGKNAAFKVGRFQRLIGLGREGGNGAGFGVWGVQGCHSFLRLEVQSDCEGQRQFTFAHRLSAVRSSVLLAHCWLRTRKAAPKSGFHFAWAHDQSATGKAMTCLFAMACLLQLLPSPPDAEGYSCDGGRHNGTCLIQGDCSPRREPQD